MILKRKNFSVDKEDAAIVGGGALATGAGAYIGGKKAAKKVAKEGAIKVRSEYKKALKKNLNQFESANRLSENTYKLKKSIVDLTNDAYKVLNREIGSNFKISDADKEKVKQAEKVYKEALKKNKEILDLDNKVSKSLSKLKMEGVDKAAKKAGRSKAGKVAAVGLALTGATLGAKKYVEKKNKEK